MTFSGVDTMPCALVGSIGISRTTTSVASMILRAGIGLQGDHDRHALQPGLAGLLLRLLMR